MSCRISVVCSAAYREVSCSADLCCLQLNWFAYFDDMDLRRHLQDIEITLIEAALDKHEGMVSRAAEALKLRRTTLIEKMRKYVIEKPANSPES